MLDHASPEVARDNLRDLVRINRFFGGPFHTASHHGRFCASPGPLLHARCGRGPPAIWARLAAPLPSATITSLDLKCVHLEQAVHPKLAGDAFLLPFAARSFDFVFSSLFLHHFSDEQVVELFRNFRTVARRAVLAIDLERGPLAYYFIPATKWLFGWHDISLYDGPVSVRAAFKKMNYSLSPSDPASRRHA